MIHFEIITSKKYLKNFPINEADFDTYNYETPRDGPSYKKAIKKKLITSNAVGRLEIKKNKQSVDNILTFSENVPTNLSKRWEKNLNIDKSKVTSKFTDD
jgi:hypothetical protein